MHRLNTALGMPQHRFASIHVVGTNGKSSVTRMTAALLEAHGVSTGACVSPHPAHWSERVLLHGAEIDEAAFAAAVERVAAAAVSVNRALEEGEVLTQFEIATAAAFVAFAAARVDAAVIEAGLGGRLDATNTIPSRVTVLTSVGLDHTEWLGETEAEIAAEKLAVLRDGTTLVLGRVSAGVAGLAAEAASRHGATLIQAPEDLDAELGELRAAGTFQRRNFALACAAAEAYLGELDRERVAAVASTLTVPGRLELVAEPPPTYLDAAHNPDGAAALAEALETLDAGPVFACLAILEDKDAAGIVAALAPALQRIILPADGPISLPGVAKSARRRWWEAEELAAMAREAGVEVEVVGDFGGALRRARELAGEEGGAALVSGSHYVLEPARAVLRSA